jgi:hypothetical protein
MLGRLTSRLTFANVCSCLALFVALGTGGAYAANTIGSADVVDDSLTGADIKGHRATSTSPFVNGSLTGYDIADRSLRADDLAGDAVTGDKVPDSSLTGSDINESTLRTVPNADKLDGIDASGFQKAGTVAISQGFSAHQDAASCPPTEYGIGCPSVLSLELPAGTYAISAKARATMAPIWHRPPVNASCKLHADADTDLAEDELFMYDPNVLAHRTATLPMQMVHSYAVTGEAVVDCNSQDTGVPYDNIKITAIKLGQASTVP